MQKKITHTDSLLLMQIIVFVLILGLCLWTPLSMLAFGVEDTLVWVAGVCALLVLFLPSLLLREYDVFQPLSFLILNVIIGVMLRSIYIIAVNDENVYYMHLMGQLPNFLLRAQIIIIISLVAFIIGYMIKFPAISIARLSLVKNDRWDTTRLIIIISLFMIIAISGAALYVKTVGITSIALDTISNKRTEALEQTSLGYHIWAASLAIPTFYVILTWFADSGRRWLSFAGVCVVFSGFFAVCFPVFNNDRGGVVIVLIIALVIWHYMRKKIRAGVMVVTIVVIMFVLMVLTALRAKVNNVSEITPYLTGQKILEILVGGRHFFGVDKTAHIINALPNKLPYEYGSTLLLWLVAPVPRTFWKQKPIISAGEVIGQELYRTDLQAKTGGVPPGIVPELYWNFGLVGVIVGMFLLGCFLKLLYQSFRRYLPYNKNALLLYIPVLVAGAFTIPGVTISGGIIDTLRQLIPMMLVLKCVGKRRPGSSTLMH